MIQTRDRALCAMIVIWALLGCLWSAAAELPTDTAVHMGSLANGLTYYIRANAVPAGRGEFWLVNKVGSAMEEEGEQGLAHFLEHMLCTGTKNFSEAEIFSFLSANGISFGGDMNARTSYEETQFYVRNVPTSRSNTIDSVLLILRDVSCNLILDSLQIEKQRTIVDDERVSYSSHEQRLQESVLPLLMPGSRLGHRAPIGIPEVISSLTSRQLLDFYHRWYRPDRQVLVIVGDFDPGLVERKVRRIFGLLPPASSPLPEVDLSVPAHKGLLIARYSDPEANASVVGVYLRHDDLPPGQRNTDTYLRRNMLRSLMCMMLRSRLDELARRPDSPLQMAMVEDTHFAVTRGTEALALNAMPKRGQAYAAIRLLLAEARRAIQHGFDDGELAIAKANLSTELRQYARQVAHHETEDYVQEYIDHCLNGGYIPGVTLEVELSLAALEGITAADVGDYLAQIVAEDDCRILVTGDDEEKLPDDEALLNLYNDIWSGDMVPYRHIATDNRPLMPDRPTPGKILSQESDSALQCVTLRLSNGATAILRPGKLKTGEVLFDAVAPGGRWACDSTAWPMLKVIEAAIEDSKLGGYDQEELRRILAGRQLSLVFALNDDVHELRGGCATAELETLMQVCHLYFTALSPDTTAWASLVDRLRSQVAQRRDKPEAMLADTAMVALYGHHALLTSLTEMELSTLKLDSIMALYRHYIARPESYTFIIAGDFDMAEARVLVERYIASLPGDSAPPTPAPLHRIGILPGRRDTRVTLPVTDNRAALQVTLSGHALAAPDEQLMLNFLAYYAEGVLNGVLREAYHLTYGVHVSAQLLRDEQRWVLNYMLDCKPENLEFARQTARGIVDTILDSDIDPDSFGSIKQHLSRRHHDDLQTNAYWLGVLRDRVLHRDAPVDIGQALLSLDKNRLDQFVTGLKPDTEVSVVVSP